MLLAHRWCDVEKKSCIFPKRQQRSRISPVRSRKSFSLAKGNATAASGESFSA